MYCFENNLSIQQIWTIHPKTNRHLCANTNGEKLG